MSDPNGRTWIKLALAFLPFIVAGSVALISTRERVSNLAQAVETKATRETVQTQYDAILRELQSIRADIAELRRRP